MSYISSAFSPIALATVRIVPSFGFITALYAVSLALSKASASSNTSIVCDSFKIFAAPRKSCESITPEFPLAPRSEPCAMALQSVAISSLCSAARFFAADIIVIVIFVPVSPSGTGKTFSSFIHSFLASKLFAPVIKALLSDCASICSRLTKNPP